MSTIFKNATLINPTENLHQKGSIKLSDQGILEEIRLDGSDIDPSDDDELVDFSDGIICSGLFDMHVHFREPGEEYKETLESGANSAQAGGFTGVAIMPNTKPAIDNEAQVELAKLKSKGLPVDIHVTGCITEGRKGEKIANYGQLKSAGVCALTDDGNAVLNSNVMKMVFEYATTFHLPLIQHCEDHTLSGHGKVSEGLYSTLQGLPGIPPVSESIILSRDLYLLREFLTTKNEHLSSYQPRYHVAHISTRYSLELVRQAKNEGLPVTCEVTPHHFTLTDEDMYHSNFDGNYCMKPPLASTDDKEAILEALKDGTIDAIATDHAPHAIHEKNGGIMNAPFGIVGLETAVGLTFSELVHKNIISTYRAVELLSSQPRKILGLEPIRFLKDSPANLSFIQPNRKWTVNAKTFKSKSQNTPFHFRSLVGKAVGTCVKGNLYLHFD